MNLDRGPGAIALPTLPLRLRLDEKISPSRALDTLTTVFSGNEDVYEVNIEDTGVWLVSFTWHTRAAITRIGEG